MSTNKNVLMNLFNGTDYDTLYPKTLVTNVTGAQPTITATGILKGAGSGSVNAATANTDYVAPTTAGEYALLNALSTISPTTSDLLAFKDVSGSTAGSATIATILGLAAGAQIATGSYTGTGTYGADNPCSLTFPFAPKFVLMLGGKNTYGEFDVFSLCTDTARNTLMLADVLTTSDVSGVGFGYQSIANHRGTGRKSEDGKTFYWSSTQNADNQFNVSGYTYYFAYLV